MTDREAFEAWHSRNYDTLPGTELHRVERQGMQKAWIAALASERAKPTKRMTPTAAQIELAKDAVAFLDLNGMHLAAGVVRRYVLKEE